VYVCVCVGGRVGGGGGGGGGVNRLGVGSYNLPTSVYDFCSANGA
jgi:hypothetical protein